MNFLTADGDGYTGMDSKSRDCLLLPSDFAEVFGDAPSPYLAGRIERYDFRYRTLTPRERDGWLRVVTEALLGPPLERAGDERIARWEAGWGENLTELGKVFDPAALVPRYFGKYGVVRWLQNYIAPLQPQFEQNSLAVIQDWLFDKYARTAPAIYEFGCGTGHNLLRARDANPTATLWGLDWAKSSQAIIGSLNRLGIGGDLRGEHFNFFEPDQALSLVPDAVVYTSAALEQTSGRFPVFIDWLRAQSPALCLHIEPISEVLDESNLLDYLSIRYFEKRNYLSGFVTYLRRLERDGLIDIHLVRRTYIGSLFIDGYSVVVWSPRLAASA
jgi:trans-aconitate methyltransferase